MSFGSVFGQFGSVSNQFLDRFDHLCFSLRPFLDHFKNRFELVFGPTNDIKVEQDFV